MSASEALLDRTYTKDEKLAIVLMVKEQDIPIPAIARNLFASEENQKKFSSMVRNWINSYEKSMAAGVEPFQGRGRRTAVYTLSDEQTAALKRIGEILKG